MSEWDEFGPEAMAAFLVEAEDEQAEAQWAAQATGGYDPSAWGRELQRRRLQKGRRTFPSASAASC